MSLMMQEIEEQPSVLERIIEIESDKITRIGDFIRSRETDVIILVARGSSDNAALYGRYLLEVTTGIPVSLAAPSVFTLYHSKMRLKRAVVIGVSQSGEGEDTRVEHSWIEGEPDFQAYPSSRHGNAGQRRHGPGPPPGSHSTKLRVRATDHNPTCSHHPRSSDSAGREE